MNELLILYILFKNQSTMYALRKQMQKLFGLITKPGFGTIQPALKRMEKQGLVTSSKFFTDGGKPYFYYSITKNGEDFLIKKILEKPSSNTSQLYPYTKIKLACSDILSEAQQFELYEMLKIELLKIEREAENIVSTEVFNSNFRQRLIIDNTICDYKNLLSLIEGLKNAVRH